jgi:hypothetical protein
MARPEKNNLTYFSHDCDMRNDIKIKSLRRKFGNEGYAIYVMMLEHLGNCDYLQYEWNDLSIELLTPDFNIDATELKKIIEYCIFLKLFEVVDGIIFCKKFIERNQHVLSKRKSFNLINSPISVLNKNKLPDNAVNVELTHINDDLMHIEKNRIEKDRIEKNSIEENSIEKNKKESISISLEATVAEEAKEVKGKKSFLELFYENSSIDPVDYLKS